jgi:hypothetical protein
LSELPLPQITEKNASNYRMGAFFGNVSFTVWILHTDDWIFNMMCYQWQMMNFEEWKQFTANREDNTRTFKRLTKEVRHDIALFQQGLRTDEGQGDFDFRNRKAHVTPHYFIGYNGECTTVRQKECVGRTNCRRAGR